MPGRMSTSSTAATAPATLASAAQHVQRQRLAAAVAGVEQHGEVADLLRHFVRGDGRGGADAQRHRGQHRGADHRAVHEVVDGAADQHQRRRDAVHLAGVGVTVPPEHGLLEHEEAEDARQQRAEHLRRRPEARALLAAAPSAPRPAGPRRRSSPATAPAGARRAAGSSRSNDAHSSPPRLPASESADGGDQRRHGRIIRDEGRRTKDDEDMSSDGCPRRRPLVARPRQIPAVFSQDTFGTRLDLTGRCQRCQPRWLARGGIHHVEEAIVDGAGFRALFHVGVCRSQRTQEPADRQRRQQRGPEVHALHDFRRRSRRHRRRRRGRAQRAG